METIASGLVFLFLVIVTLDGVYRKGHRDGYRAAVQTEPPAPDMCLEVLDTYTSGRVFWRYGTGTTELTGFCEKATFPAEALDTVATHHALQNEQRHLDAADELVDEFLSTHGPFRNLDNGL